MQLSLLVPAAGLTLRNVILIGIGGAIGPVVVMLVLAQAWRFPIPFSFVIAGPIWQLSMIISAILAIGKANLRANPKIVKQIKATIPLWSVQSTLIVIYPVFNAFFLRLSGLAQVSFVSLLPIIKHIMNLLVQRVTNGIPAANAIGMVSVKLFDALYVFKCMGSAASIVSGAVLIAFDLLLNIYHFRSLHERIRKMKTDLANSSVNTETTIQASMARVASRSHSTLYLRPAGASAWPRNTVAPSPLSECQALSPIAALRMPTSSEQAHDALDEHVRLLLLDAERIALVEFVECAVPLFYAVYLLVLFHLPNVIYYPEFAKLNAARLSSTVSSIMAYATLEFASLLYVHCFMRWKLKISALHMVANVLERDNAVLQSVFMTWVVSVLQLTLEHGGTWQFLTVSCPRSDLNVVSRPGLLLI